MIQSFRQYRKTLNITIIGVDLTTNPYAYQTEVRQNQKLWTIQKTLSQFNCLHLNLTAQIFELEKNFQFNKIGKEDPQKSQLSLKQFIKTLLSRIDVITNDCFRKFFQLTIHNKKFQVITEQESINIKDKQYQCVTFAWESHDQGIFTAYNKKKTTEKISNFFKTLLSKEVKQGLIRFHKKVGNNWVQKWQNIIQGQVFIAQLKIIQLNWSRKSSMLIVATKIGLQIYRIYVEQEYCKNEIIDYTAIPNLLGIAYDPLSATTYAFSNNIIYLYSQKKQELYQPVTSLIGISSIAIDHSEKRLFASDKLGVHIFDIGKESFCIYLHTLQADSVFVKQAIGGKNSQFLFGLSEKGYITVFQLKQKKKQKLISVLTNIECPEQSSSLKFSFHFQLLIVDYRDNLYLINTKNQPIFSVSTGNQKLRVIEYDEQKECIITLGQKVTIYNFGKLQ